jgi:hypothetical protein
MKKIALTSLLAVFAVSGAHAANVIDGNPLYMPKAGHFYSETALESHTNNTPDPRKWAVVEDFGYGVTDRFAVNVATSLSEREGFEIYNWDGLKLGATFRALDAGAWKADIVAAYDAEGFYLNRPAGDDNKWFDKDATEYTWTAGVRGGYVAKSWTLAAHALFNYWNTESFKWNADEGLMGAHTLALGLDAQYVITPHLNLVAGVEYTGRLDKHDRGVDTVAAEIHNAGVWAGTFGVNYNIDATKYVGLYVNGEMNHQGGDEHNKWVAEKGFGAGIKFGIDF